MKFVAVVFVITSCIGAINAQYSSDDLTVDLVLSNERILNNYINCLLDRGLTCMFIAL